MIGTWDAFTCFKNMRQSYYIDTSRVVRSVGSKGAVLTPDQEEQCRQFTERCAVRGVGDSDAASAHEAQFARQAPGNSEAGIAASSGTVVGSSGLIVPQYPAGAGIQNWPSATNTGFATMPS